MQHSDLGRVVQKIIGERGDGLVLHERGAPIVLDTARRQYLDDQHRVQQGAQAIDGREAGTAARDRGRDSRHGP